MTTTIRPKDIVALRRSGRRRPFVAAELPPGVPAAYDMAAAMLGLMEKPVAAWKLGATTAGTRKAFSTDTIYYGGIVAEEVWCAAEGGEVPSPLLLRGEAEIAFCLAVDIAAEESARALAQDAEVLFDAWAPVIEAPYSCVENLPDAGLPALLMDRCAAGGLYMAAPRRNIRDAAISSVIEILADDTVAGRGDAATSLLMTPLEAALDFLKIAAAQGVGVRRGQWISTGGITPCVDLPFGRPVSLRFGGETVFTLVVPPPNFKTTS